MAQHWTGSNWMKLINENKKLSELTVPGTHDSCAVGHGPSVACQEIDVEKQLTEGIRFLDIRCRQFKDGFPIHHDSVSLGMNFGNVQETCVKFLQMHPSECIILKVKPEYKAEDNVFSFEKIFKSYVYGERSDGYNTDYSSFWYLKNEVPLLKDVRGRIVLLREFSLDAHSAPLGINVSNWEDNRTFQKVNGDGVTYYVQDHYDFSTLFGDEKKWKDVKSLLEIAKEQTNGPDHQYTWFLNFTSASGGAFPRTFATGNPGARKGVNRFIKDFLTSDTNFLKGIYRWGTIISDFPDVTKVSKDENLIQLIIKCNGI